MVSAGAVRFFHPLMTPLAFRRETGDPSDAIVNERRAVSRDLQVRVVFCDWLAWLLCMKKPEHGIILKSVIDLHETGNHNHELVTFNNADAGSSNHDTRLACSEVVLLICIYRREVIAIL